MKKLISIMMALVLVLSFAACGEKKQEEQKVAEPAPTISFSTGRQGVGVLYPFTVAVCENLKKEALITDYSLIPSGVAATPALIQSEEAQIGLCTTDTVFFAVNGKALYDAPIKNMQLFARTYPGYNYIVTFADNTEINTVEDLKGKRVNVGAAGQVQNLLAGYIFEAAGFSMNDLADANTMAIADAIEEMKMGNLDAIFVSNSIPLATILELNTTKQLKMVKYSDSVLKKAKEAVSALDIVTLKADQLYEGMTEDYTTLANSGCLMLDSSLSEEFVYNLTKSYVEHFAEYQDIVAAMKNINIKDEFTPVDGVEFHPGVVKYLKEVGWMK